MTDATPALEVGFAIETGGSFDELLRLQEAMNTTEARVVAEAAKIERATAGMVNVGGAVAQVTAFGNAATRELQSAVRETAKVERAGESLVRQLERQGDAFGLTRTEIRAMKSETAALAAEQQGLVELAGRIRAAESALYDKEFATARREAAEAQALAEERALQIEQAAEQAARERAAAEAGVIAQLREKARLEQVIQRATGLGAGSATDRGASFQALEGVMRSEAAAAEQLAREHAELAAQVRASAAAEDANAAAAQRMRAATDPLYAATSRLNAEIEESTRLYFAGVTSSTEYARQQGVLTERLREVERAHEAATGSTGKLGQRARLTTNEMTNLGFQLNDVFVSLASGQKPLTVFIQQGAQIGQIAAASGVGLRGMASSVIALMAPFAPLIAILAVAAGGFALFDRAVSKGVDTKAMVNSLGLTRAEIKRLKDTSVDTGDVVVATFQVLAERVGLHLGDVKKFFTDAMDWLTVKGRQTLAALYTTFVGTFKGIAAIIKGVYEGKAIKDILADADKAVMDTYNGANDALTKLGADITKKIGANKLAELRKQADEIKKDRTPKTDRHAEQLAREAEATERQIANLYKLADAYGVSGGAALVAEARVKAESAAIKKRADIEAMVARQVRLAIAERVKDAAQSTAAMEAEASMMARVRADVAAGNILASQANEILRDRMADIPLLDALEAARQTKDVVGAQKILDLLEKQRTARIDLADEQRKAALQASQQTADNQLEYLREELRLVGATEEVRVRTLAIVRATQEAQAGGQTGPDAARWIKAQGDIAVAQFKVGVATERLNENLRDMIESANRAGDAMARAFGRAGGAISDALSTLSEYLQKQTQLDEARRAAAGDQERIRRIDRQQGDLQLSTTIGLIGATKNLFSERSKGYRAMEAAEKALTIIQLARTAVDVAGGAARMFASLGPFAFPVVAAMLGVMASLGFSGGGSAGSKPAPSNTGTGTVLGDTDAKSESIKRAIDSLKEVDTLTNTYAREMAASLRSIDGQIGNVAALVVRAGDINASAGVTEGFKTNLGSIGAFGPLGSLLGKIPVVGGILKSLFGTSTKVLASGLSGDAQSLASILNGGFDASYYSDIQKKKKFLGLNYSTKYRTQYAAADPTLENQFTLILRSFNDAITAAAGPLGAATSDIQNRLNSFVVNIGKIDLKDLSGEEIQEKLSAVFGAAADQMAAAAFPGIERFQKVGEGAFETLVRVASTVEQVTNSLDMLGQATQALGIDAKMALADQFEDVGELASVASAYFDRFYSKAEQNTARTAQLQRVFTSLNLTMPATLEGYRQLVEAQNLNTDAGRAAYATLLQLAPAFADLQAAMNGARSAADILAEREDLQRKLLEVQGNTAALRALDLAKLDASNRALQEQIWAVQDAQEAAKAAEQLRQAWADVGTSIMDEVKRIRGLTDPTGNGSFAALMGQFNAATAAARGGDQDAAKSLPGLSQALLKAAADSATSRQELERVQAQTAASLEATFAAIQALSSPTTAANTANALLAAMSASKANGSASNDNGGGSAIDDLHAEIEGLRSDITTALATIAGNTGRTAKKLEDVTAASGGDAISVVGEAA